MKKESLKTLLYSLFVLLVLTACGSDDNDGGGGGNDDGVNTNKNIVTEDDAVTRLEFPHLKGGSSIVLVYRTSDNNAFDKDRVNYCVEWDCEKKSQRWSCYQLHAGNTGEYSRVTNDYPNDPNLNTDYYWTTDYIYNSGFQHGHICPSADRVYSYQANYQTFYMTNMQPQYRRFNAYSSNGSDKGEGLWLRMENKVRSWTPRNTTDTLYICKGGTIDREDQIITRLQGRLIVPRYFFMAVLRKNQSGYAAIAFYAEQKDQWGTDDNLGDYAMSIDELEEKTGIDFFCNLPDKTENSVESKKVLRIWGLD